MVSYREKFFENMVLKGYAEATKESYFREVKRFFDRMTVKKSPEKVVEEDLRVYFLHLKNDRNYGVSAMKAALCGLRFFFFTA